MIGAGASETIDVRTALNNSDFARVFNLYDLMFVPKAGGLVDPGLIEQATPNADATLWTLKVRDGVTWHDGKPLTADDIVYTIQHSWGDSGNYFNAVLSLIVDFARVQKTGPLEVRVPLKVGVAQFPQVAAFVNCLVVQEGTKNFGNGIGTGPFKLKTFTPGSRSEFVANKDYWVEGQPYVDELIVDSTFSDDSAVMDALLANSINILPGASPILARANAGSGRIVLGNRPGPGFVGMACRVDTGPLADERIRQALKLVMDRPKYVATAFSNFATVGNDIGGATNQYWASDLKAVHDPDKAASLLKQAGAQDLHLELDTSAAYAGMNEIASLFVQDAKQAGITVTLNKTAPSTYFTPAAGFLERSFAMTGYTTGMSSMASFFLSSLAPGAPYQETHWGNPKDNALLFDALAETDDAKAKDKWHAVQERQFDSGGYLIPTNINWLDGYGLNVRGVQTTSGALNCDNYRFAPAWLEQ